ncbi:MAG: peptidase M28 [Proteobacteria bacterium]|nr:MAG: peptidase M28 [Pseudomonadota bacterium]
MHELIRELLPFPRAMTGDGVRRTLAVVGRHLPLAVHEVPSGSQVLDWVVPPEWNVREAWIAGPDGRRVADLRDSTLHLASYSEPVRARMTLAELRPHLFSLPERPDWIPYRHFFHRAGWGFCLPHRRLEALPDGEYEVCIDATLAPGSLTYGEAVIRGETDADVLLCAHVCHPALCNDNLSGIALLSLLGAYLDRMRPRLGYRLLFAPVTIGAICWLARNAAVLPRIQHGLVVTLLGDPGPFTYKRSRRGDAPIDRALAHVLRHAGPHALRDFSPVGYDERQFGSPGFDLPVGCLMRTPHGEFPEYHTSADDLSFVRPEALSASLGVVLAAIGVLERDARYENLCPRGEPQLGRRGIYRTLATRGGGAELEQAVLWVLNLSDGRHGLLDIAERSGLAFDRIHAAAAVLREHGLLRRIGG